MNKKFLLVLLSVIVLACNFLLPRKTTSTPESIVAPQTSNQPELTTTGFTIVRLHPNDGDLQTMLADQAQKALTLDQTPVVEFDATWCPPCRAIDAGIQSQNQSMLNAYQGTYIIKLDVDEWGWDNGKVQSFHFDAIPVYFKLDSEGDQTGEIIDGAAWGEDIPENIAPVMDAFFHGK